MPSVAHADSKSEVGSELTEVSPPTPPLPDPTASRSGDETPTLAAELEQISGGNVVAIPPSGPVFANHPPPRRRSRPETFVAALPNRDRLVIALMTAGWAISLTYFWVWWPRQEHRLTGFGTTLNSLLLVYLVSQPIYAIIAANRLRQVDPKFPVPRMRVAFVVTRAPSDPWEVLEKTLTAMLAQRFPYPYDVWLCDEKPGVGQRWCEENGVHVSTRFGVEAYHRDVWPRRTRCKEGNLAYFYDHYGYQNYDVVAQLDSDHVPSPTYLAEMVRPFTDPAVGYVAAPSMCDSNAKLSWSARGRVNWEALFHGPVQLGYNDGLGPVCIGSHYAVRTAALRQIGGLGPELAEDFSTSFLLTSAGWEGVFSIAAEAHGEGPLSFPDMVVQEFQWSRSLTTLGLRMVPRHLPRLGMLVRLRYVYCLLHYSLLALLTIGGLMLPPIAAVTGSAWMSVNYAEFLLRWWLVTAWIMGLAWFLRRRGMRRPEYAPIVSWESWLYALSRWPYFARGVVASLIEQLRPRVINLRVTPKSLDGMTYLRPSLVAPYVFVSVALGICAIVGQANYTSTIGYVFLSVVGSFTYLVVSFAVCILHALEASRRVGASFATAIKETVADALLLSALTIPFAVVNIAIFPTYAIGVFGW